MLPYYLLSRQDGDGADSIARELLSVDGLALDGRRAATILALLALAMVLPLA